MPNIKGAAKRMRQAAKNRQRNIEVRTRVKKVRSKVLAGAPTSEAQKELFRAYCSELDKAVKKGVIQKNTAIRRKGRAAARLLRAPAAAPAPAPAESSPASAAE